MAPFVPVLVLLSFSSVASVSVRLMEDGVLLMEAEADEQSVAEAAALLSGQKVEHMHDANVTRTLVSKPELDEFDEWNDDFDDEFDAEFEEQVTRPRQHKDANEGRRLKERPAGMSLTGWQIYSKAMDTLSGVRGRTGNVIMSLAGLGLGDSCITKIVFILYTHEDEDDYPYLPRGCGGLFDAMAAAPLLQPWHVLTLVFVLCLDRL